MINGNEIEKIVRGLEDGAEFRSGTTSLDINNFVRKTFSFYMDRSTSLDIEALKVGRLRAHEN